MKKLFRRGRKKAGLLMAVIIMLIFTAGISWGFGYYNSGESLSLLHLGNEIENEGESKVPDPVVSEQKADKTKEDQLDVSDIPIVSEAIIAESQNAGTENVGLQMVETIPMIRVLIHTSDYQRILHDEIIITSSKPFLLSWTGGEELFSANSTVTIEPDDLRLKEGTVTFSGEGGFILSNVHRECGHPTYPGKLEIIEEEGKLALVNEVDLESYLCLVVPGEMPTSYGVEALKVQAVCARSYAWCQMNDLAYERYNAHVDDSVNDQVYNNQQPTAESDQAVADTCGLVLEYEDQVIETYYFSTSCGHTTDMEIWNGDPEEYPYYPAAALTSERECLALASEETFRSFIDWYRDSVDEGFDFYRWEIELSMDEISESVDIYLKEKGLNGVGEVTDLQVASRGNGGIIQELIITGTEGKAVLERQGSVREALGGASMVICLEDGREVTGWSMIPSAFFYLDERIEEGKTIGYTLRGGGYGHGVGMSQNGVYRMVSEGYDYDQVLNFFYPGTYLTKVFP